MKNESSKTFNNYLFNKSVLQYGIPTAVLCLIIYFFITKEPLPIQNIGSDLVLSVLITVFICAITAIFGIRSDLKKGIIPEVESSGSAHPIFRIIPHNAVLHALLITAVASILFAVIPGCIGYTIAALGVKASIPATPWFIIKSLYSGAFTAISMAVVTSAVAHEA